MERTFGADLKFLRDMIAFIIKGAEEIGFSAADLRKIELATEEALVNIIHHGGQNESGNIKIKYTALPSFGIEISLCDQGVAFNPLRKIRTAPDSSSVEQRRHGGHGIDLIVDLMDYVDYQRIDHCNFLTLKKYI